LVSGIVVGVAAEAWRRYWTRPIVRIVEDQPEYGGDWSCHAIKVTNLGRSAAQRCQGQVSIEDVDTDHMLERSDVTTIADPPLPTSKFDIHGDEQLLLSPSNFRRIDSELVVWSRIGNPVEVDIHPNTHALLDVARYMQFKTPQIHIPSETGWKAIRCALKPRRYELTVRVSPINGRYPSPAP
jgi:hypothetical protein